MNELYQYFRKNYNFIEATKICKTLAEDCGRNESIYNLATHYMDGEGVTKDPEKAFEWYTKAADRGMHLAILELIKSFWLTDGPKKDLGKAFEWSKFLVENGKTSGEDRNRPIALVLLARCYLYGQGVKKNPEEGFKYFKEAAALGEKNALIHMAMAYQYGNGVEKNLEEAIKYWENVVARKSNELIHAGLSYDARAFELQQEAIGLKQKGNTQQATQCHQKATQYFKIAYKYYQAAAKSGDAQAMYNIACHHAHSTFCRKNLEEAEKWFINAANLGYMEAKASLGKIYLFRKPPDLPNAEKWLTEAANEGSPDAMLDLGWLYGMIKKDKETSLDWYKKAAALGNSTALYNCGALLLNSSSEGKIDDETLALFYLNQSAEKDFAPAMTLLGKYYLERSDKETEKGQQNAESAYFWLKKAAALDNFEAKTLLQEAEKETVIDELELSQDFEKCLRNLENIEKGELEGQEETKTINTKRFSPFDAITVEDPATDSSDDESEDTSLKVKEIELESSSITQEESLETSIQSPFTKKDLIKNPKFLRAQLREVRLIVNQEKEKNSQASQKITLSKASENIVTVLRNEHLRGKITGDVLSKLFSDKYFENKGGEKDGKKGGVQVKLGNMKVKIVAKNFNKLGRNVITRGTHENHDRTYEGYNPEFLKGVVEILEWFGA